MNDKIGYMIAVAGMLGTNNNRYMMPDVKWDYHKNFDRREKFLKTLSVNAIEKNVKVTYDSEQRKYIFTAMDGTDLYVSDAKNMKRARQDFRKWMFSFSYKWLGEIEDKYGKPCNDD